MTDLPTIGLFGINNGVCAEPDAAARIGALAEDLGYDSLWVSEHVVAPRPRVPPSPMEPDYPILDPVVALSFLAAQTRRVRLATGIVVLPQRNPVVLAKQLASLDVISRGRLTLGIGVGYLEPELSAVGVPMAGRGARADEYLAAMRALWYDEAPEFRGRYVEFAGVDGYPRPVQDPIPVVVGGHTVAAHRRAVRHGDGWYGYLLDREATATHVASLRAEAEAAGRDLDGFTITISPKEPLDAGLVGDYAGLGVSRLVLVPHRALRRSEYSLPELEALVRACAPERIGALPAGG